MNAFKTDWPDSVSIKGTRYLTPDGPFPRVTSILKAFGGGTEGLIAWSAKMERAACLEAASVVWAEETSLNGGDEFEAAVLERLGPSRAHQKKLAAAAEIGTSIHAMIQWTLKAQMGEDPGQKPALSDPAEVAFMSWQDWWRTKRLHPIRVEQPIWHPAHGYAGTIDLIAEGPDGLEVWDWKSSAGIYETHHMQLAAYVFAARNWAPVQPGGIVKMPKSLTEDLTVKEVPIGHLYGGKILTMDELFFDGFLHALSLYRLFLDKPGKD